MLGFQAASKRWSVRIAGEPKAMAVLPQNLTPVVQRGVDALPAGGAVARLRGNARAPPRKLFKEPSASPAPPSRDAVRERHARWGHFCEEASEDASTDAQALPSLFQDGTEGQAKNTF